MENHDNRSKLYIGDLPCDITQSEFHDFFGQFGEIHMNESYISSRKHSKRKFGYVTYVKPEVATHVAKFGDNNEGFGGRIVMRGKVCEIKPCRTGNDRTGNDRTGNDRNNKNDKPQLFIGGLPPNMTDLELRDLFQQFGQLDESNTFVVRDKNTNRPRGCGYIKFTDPEIAKLVLKIRDNDFGNSDKKDGIGFIVMRGFTVCPIYKVPVKYHESRRDHGQDLDDHDPELDRYCNSDHDLQSEQDQPFTPRKRAPPPPSSKKSGIGDDNKAMNKRTRYPLNEDEERKDSSPSPSALTLPSSSSSSLVSHYVVEGMVGIETKKKKLVYIRNVPGFLSSSKVTEILKDRFNYAYQRYLLIKCCSVREKFGDALIEVCNNEDDYMALLQLENRTILGHTMELMPWSSDWGDLNDFVGGEKTKILQEEGEVEEEDPSSSQHHDDASNDKKKHSMLLRDHEALMVQHNDTMKRNTNVKMKYKKCKQLEWVQQQQQFNNSRNFNDSNDNNNEVEHHHHHSHGEQQTMMIESLKQQLTDSDQRVHKLSETVSKQTCTINDVMEEKREIIQRLQDEVSIRHTLEKIFDEEKLELSKLLETEVSRRKQLEEQQEEKEMKKSRPQLTTTNKCFNNKEESVINNER
jgi:RNA recognition motif-containing protein